RSGALRGTSPNVWANDRWRDLRIAEPGNRFRVFILATNTASTRPQGVEQRSREGLRPRPELGSRRNQTPANTANSGQLIRAIDAVPKHTGATGIRSGIASSTRSTGPHRARVAWGAYEPAIRRWETIIGRAAPSPTEPTGRDGKPQLSAKFTEWIMGLDQGWVTDVPDVSRAEQIKMCGNGVVPQQAYEALRRMKEVA